MRDPCRHPTARHARRHHTEDVIEAPSRHPALVSHSCTTGMESVRPVRMRSGTARSAAAVVRHISGDLESTASGERVRSAGHAGDRAPSTSLTRRPTPTSTRPLGMGSAINPLAVVRDRQESPVSPSTPSLAGNQARLRKREALPPGDHRSAQGPPRAVGDSELGTETGSAVMSVATASTRPTWRTAWRRTMDRTRCQRRPHGGRRRRSLRRAFARASASGRSAGHAVGAVRLCASRCRGR